MTGSAGSTYYFRVRAHDAAGNVGNWSAQDLTIVPYDNAQMNLKGGWRSLTVELLLPGHFPPGQVLVVPRRA